MTKKDPKKDPTKQDVEAEVWNAISAFEQILEAMPNDRASLETLSHAYEQVGDEKKAGEYLVRLANVMLDESDIPGAAQLLIRLKARADEDKRARELVERIEKLSGKTAGAEAPPSATAHPQAAEQTRAETKPRESLRTAFNIAEELSFAWSLLQSKDLTQEEYSNVVQDLTEMSATDALVTVSVLHALHDRTFRNLEGVLASVSKQCNTPIISLASFDLQADTVSLLPFDFMVRRGAVVFEMLGKNALVALLNPYDKQLRKEIEITTGRRCHYYLTLPAQFDEAIAKIKQMQAPKTETSES